MGIRELRQHASRYVARVELGESLTVTDRGRAVAMLVPVAADPWATLLAGGIVRPPELDGDVLDELPGGYVFASERLATARDDER